MAEVESTIAEDAVTAQTVVLTTARHQFFKNKERNINIVNYFVRESGGAPRSKTCGVYRIANAIVK